MSRCFFFFESQRDGSKNLVRNLNCVCFWVATRVPVVTRGPSYCSTSLDIQISFSKGEVKVQVSSDRGVGMMEGVQHSQGRTCPPPSCRKAPRIADERLLRRLIFLRCFLSCCRLHGHRVRWYARMCVYTCVAILCMPSLSALAARKWSGAGLRRSLHVCVRCLVRRCRISVWAREAGLGISNPRKGFRRPNGMP